MLLYNIKNNTRTKIWKAAKLSAIGVIGGFLSFTTWNMLFPSGATNALNSTDTSEVNVVVNPYVEINASSNNVNLSQNATLLTGGGYFMESDAVVISTASNDPLGYDVYVEMVGSETSLIHERNVGQATPIVSTSISPISSGGVAKSTFSNASDTTTKNKWGFSTDDTTFYPVAANGLKTSKILADGSGDATTNIYFAAKTGTDLVSGKYVGTVVFTAVGKTVTTGD